MRASRVHSTETAVTSPLVSLDDIRLAAERLRVVARRTPLLQQAVEGGPPLALKCESLQRGGAFKIRGACNMVAQLTPSVRSPGVITYSSGNHGRAVAMVAEIFGVPSVVVMPEQAPAVKVEGVRRHGAEVIFAGTTSADRQARAEDVARRRGLVVVPPFDHPWIIAGQGTIGLEIIEQHPSVRTIFVPVGGGGQIAGVSAAVKAMRDGVHVVGVEPENAARMAASLAAGRPVTLERTSSIADGLLPTRPGDLTFAHVRAFVDALVTVSDAEIVAAMRWLFAEARLVVEPSGAAAVAAALRAGAPDAVAVVSGGNVDARAFASYILDDTR